MVYSLFLIVVIILLAYIGASGYSNNFVKGRTELVIHHAFHLGKNLLSDIRLAIAQNITWRYCAIACLLPSILVSLSPSLPPSILHFFCWVEARRIIGSKIMENRRSSCVHEVGRAFSTAEYHVRGLAAWATTVSPAVTHMWLLPGECGRWCVEDLSLWWWAGASSGSALCSMLESFNLLLEDMRSHWSLASWGINWSVCFLDSV